MKKKRLNQSGFTLIELMIVISLIALIGSFVVVQVSKRYAESQVNATQIQIKQMGTVLDDFRRVCGFYPLTEQGLDALVTKPQGRECKNYDPEGFLKRVPQDAWGNEFEYEGTPSRYKICSLGADGTAGGEGFDADICSDQI